jgi:hypothetical protein
VSRARCVVLNLVNTSFGCAREILRSLYDTLTKPIYERFAGQDKHLVSEVQWIVGLGLIPYAIAVLMPSWRWLLAVTLIIGGALAAIWIQDWVVRSDPGYRGGGFGEALGLAFGYVITTAFATGVGIRAITLILASRGLRLRHVFTICVAGIALVPAIIIVPSAWHEWQMQPPSEACSNATFHVKVANAEFVIPSPPVFIVYLANTSSRNAYYFFSNPSLRAFCGLSDNGKQSVTATNISLRFDRFRNSAPTICASPIPDWAKTHCAAHAKPSDIDSIDFPLQIYVFAPEDFALGEFGASRSTYDDSLHARPRSNGPVFITSQTLTPDQHPLTFECNANGTGYWCKTSYPWSNGASLNYAFRSGRDDVAIRGVRIDVEARKFLSGLKAQH